MLEGEKEGGAGESNKNDSVEGSMTSSRWEVDTYEADRETELAAAAEKAEGRKENREKEGEQKKEKDGEERKGERWRRWR
mmetsp:Transcript_37788/g.55274  ORF Transcript_37788/g.55274 Transcript_37788/m.55274 type:complete len:80 (+) Transcript_37788:2572-2811(+)